MIQVSAVVPHFFETRERNLGTITESLFAGTIAPIEVIIWNNTPFFGGVASPDDRVHIVQSPWNIGPAGRLLAAMIARGTHVLFLDNDTAVRTQTVENLIRWSTQWPWSVVTLEGREGIRGARYGNWPKYYGHDLMEPRRVFHTLGRGELVPKRIVNQALGHFPFDALAQHDDLLLSNAYSAIDVPVRVVPCVRGISDLADLPMGGEGMCKSETFHEERNAVIQGLEGLRERGVS